jgi:uncharacterized protein (TIGR03118 family)
MRHSIRDLQESITNRGHKRRSNQNRPVVEGLENRALLSAAHELIVHEHFAARGKKPVSGYQQINLVSDLGGVAQITDSNLVNPWGISFSTTGAGSPVWVSNQRTGTSTIYTISQSNTLTKSTLTVTIPAVMAGSTGSPTGQVHNSTTDFGVRSTSGTVPAVFIFDTLQGTIEAWNPGSLGGASSAVIVATASSAVYTGLAAGSTAGNNYIYAANDNASPGIDVYNGSFTKTTLTGNFVDPKLSKGFLPYNIQNIGGELFVTYRGSNFKGGAVAEFNTDGTFVRQLAFNKKGGNLQAPWGVAMAPANFGKFSNDLLVGNFTSGRIDAYTAKGKFKGRLATTKGKPITIPGLWVLAFGDGGSAGPANSLIFTAGIDHESHGLFGVFQSVTK